MVVLDRLVAIPRYPVEDDQVHSDHQTQANDGVEIAPDERSDRELEWELRQKAAADGVTPVSGLRTVSAHAHYGERCFLCVR